MDSKRLTTYLCSLYPDLPEDLKALEQEARDTDVPIIRRDTQQLLRFMMETVRPKRILEVGTAVGFSAMFMAATNPIRCKITTIEDWPPRIEAAKKNFTEMGYADRITLLEGDAMEILPTISGTFDFIFMDAAKGQYIHYWPQIVRLCQEGTVVVTDNVLQDGDVIESHYAVTRRNRTIHKRMREYLYTLTHDERFATDILPVGDGVSISVRKKTF